MTSDNLSNATETTLAASNQHQAASPKPQETATENAEPGTRNFKLGTFPVGPVGIPTEDAFGKTLNSEL
jgi:hypothetical protein